MLVALAFAPNNNVFEDSDQLCGSIQPVDADDFENHYIGCFRRNAPRKLPRMDNSVEDHIELSKLADLSFLGILKHEKSLARVFILQALGGNTPPSSETRIGTLIVTRES